MVNVDFNESLILEILIMWVGANAANPQVLRSLQESKFHQINSVRMFLKLELNALVHLKVGSWKSQLFFGDSFTVDHFGLELNLLYLHVRAPVRKLLVFRLFFERNQIDASCRCLKQF
jgi:hypothetical protein